MAGRVLTPEERARAVAILRSNFAAYAAKCLKIKPKVGGEKIPFTFNAAQAYLHQQIEIQRASKGRVRILVLKGRQQGISTYSEGRLYWQVATKFGRKAYVLAHKQEASDNLFSMVDAYFKGTPMSMRPHVGRSNSKELVFDRLESKIEVATAGSEGTGRGGTAQYMHGSEVAFWQNAAAHLAGIGQTIPNAPDTEIILETTANGTANVYHDMWTIATRGESDYLPVFIPWYWQPEYAIEPPPGFVLTAEEAEYAQVFDLTAEQMAWRRAKIATDFKGDVSLFNQEYPATAELAFASSSPRALIPVLLISAARKARGLEPIGHRVMSCDPAEYGSDFTSVWIRQGRVARRLGTWNGLGTMESCGRVGLMADAERPDEIVVDATGVGTGLADRLIEMGYPVTRVHFGEAAIDDKRYVKRRDELWGDMKDWFEDKPASIEDDDDVAKQLSSVQYTYDSSRRVKVESKEEMKKRGLRSPDDGDALALTFGGMRRAGGEDDAQYWRGRRS